jgi:hypothetical protein
MLSQFLEFFKRTFWSPKPQARVIEVKPEDEKFRPQRRNRWVLAIEGLDTFLVKSAQLPMLWAAADRQSFLTAQFYEIEGQSIYSQFQEWCQEKKSRQAVFKFINAAGSATEVWTMTVKPLHATPQFLDYGDPSPVITEVVMQVENIRVEVTDA